MYVCNAYLSKNCHIIKFIDKNAVQVKENFTAKQLATSTFQDLQA